MNRLSIILAMTLLILISCGEGSKKPSGNSVTILVDITDSFSVVRELSADKLRGLFDISKDVNAAAKFTVCTIENLRYTETIEYSVPGTTDWEGNILHRMALSDSFFARLESAILHTQSKAIGRNGSYIGYAVSRAVNGMVEDSATYKRRELILLTDLREHTPAFSCYRMSDISLLRENPDSVYRLMDSLYPLPDLSSISITIVFKAENSLEDDAFYEVSKFWKEYYKRRHAIVKIFSSIPEN